MSKAASSDEPAPLEGTVKTKEPAIEIKKEEENKTAEAEGANSNGSKTWRHFRGVTYHRKNNKWIAQASVNGKSKYLGTHATREKAARVYDAFVLSTYGSTARTNFPASEVDFSLIPRLRSYKKKPYAGMGFNMLGIGAAYMNPKKDPKHPKHPRNAYLIFASEQRKIMKENGLKCQGRGNMHKQFAERWKQMSMMEKQKYIDLAAADRNRYEQEMDTYEDPQAFAWMNSDPVPTFPMMQMGPPDTKNMLPPGIGLAHDSLLNGDTKPDVHYPDSLFSLQNSIPMPHPLLIKNVDSMIPKP